MFEVHTWKEVRGPAGAVRFETRCAKSGCSGTPLLFEGQVAVDMSVVQPLDAKKMKRARMVYWKTSKHEREELKERVWAGATQSYASKADQRSVDRQPPKCDEEAGVEGDWMLKRLYDIGFV